MPQIASSIRRVCLRKPQISARTAVQRSAALDMQRQTLALARMEFPVTHDFLADKRFTMSGVSAYVTKLAISITEDFWCIVTPRRVKISQKSAGPPARVPAEKLVRDIRRATRKHHSAEDKIRIVLEGLRGEESIAALCRREAIAERACIALGPRNSWVRRWRATGSSATPNGKRRLAGAA